MATATDPLPPITTSDENAVPKGSSADEKSASTNTSADTTSESKSGDEIVVDEKVAPTSTSAENDTTSQSKVGDETAVDEIVAPTSTSVDNDTTSESKSRDEKTVDEKGEKPTQEEEEEEECGFCLFMKGGPCGEQFKQWQECVEGAEKSEKDIVEQCAPMTTMLKVCMEANPQYYGPVLDAEKAMQADIDSVEESRMDTSKSSKPPAGEGLERMNGEQTVETVEASVATSKSSETPAVKDGEIENREQAVETMETLHVVINDDGKVVEAVDVVEVEVRAV